MMTNFLGWDRRWLDVAHGGDHVGRSVWGLGELIGQHGPYTDEARTLMARVTPAAMRSVHTRPVVYATLGLLASGDESGPVCDHLTLARARLIGIGADMARDRPGRDVWRWPEPRLTYDNARLAEAMVGIGTWSDDNLLVDRGLELMSWLFELCDSDGFVRVPGHFGLAPGDDVNNSGDEQPLEVAALLDAACRCGRVTGDSVWRERASQCWSWFMGINRCLTPVADITDGHCADGLGDRGPSRNSGAESTIAFHRACVAWQALLCSDDASSGYGLLPAFQA